MKNFVIINGVNSNTINGLGINELPPISKPSMRVLTEEIDGRDGDITTNLGYSAYDKTITIGLFGTGYDINSIISFFNGEGTIVFSNEDDKYYKYKIVNQIDYEALQKFKQATITFHCQPFKYPTSETPLEIEYDYIEQTGETLTLNNTGNALMELNLKGNTSQYTTTGKNLINVEEELTFTRSKLIECNLPAGTYHITNLSASNSQSTNTIQFRFYDNNVSFILTSGSDITKTLSATETKIYIYSNGDYSGSAGISATIKQLMVSANGGEYEPYTNGASPNPTYPQPINVVSGDNEIVVCGKNLLNLDRTLGEPSDTALSNTHKRTFNYNEFVIGITGNNYYYPDFVSSYSIQNGTISVKTSGTAYYGVGFPMKTKQNTTYTMSFSGETNSRVNVGFYKNDGTFINYEGNAETFTFTTPSNCDFIVIVFTGTQANTTYTFTNVMLELGNEDTSYEPYQSQTYPINLPVENLFDKDNANTIDCLVNGSTGLITSYTGAKTLYIPIKSKETYTISKVVSARFAVGTCSSTPANNVSCNVYTQDNTKSSLTITSGASDTYLCVFYYLSGTDTLTEQEILNSIQIELGSKKNSYTPYGTTPIELCKIGDYQDYFTKNSGKNLVNTLTRNGNTVYVGDISTPTFIFEAGTYTISYESSKTIGTYIQKESDATSTNLGNDKTITFTSNEKFSIWFWQSGLLVEDIIHCQLEKGNQKTTYEPYGTGQWCKYNAIGKVVLDGSENYSNNGQAGTVTEYVYTPTIAKKYGKLNIICDHFTCSEIGGERILGRDNNGNVYFRILTTTASDTTAFKTWLGTHNTTIYYVLKTPYLSLIGE